MQDTITKAGYCVENAKALTKAAYEFTLADTAITTESLSTAFKEMRERGTGETLSYVWELLRLHDTCGELLRMLSDTLGELSDTLGELESAALAKPAGEKKKGGAAS